MFDAVRVSILPFTSSDRGPLNRRTSLLPSPVEAIANLNTDYGRFIASSASLATQSPSWYDPSISRFRRQPTTTPGQKGNSSEYSSTSATAAPSDDWRRKKESVEDSGGSMSRPSGPLVKSVLFVFHFPF
jgi:hypothetical protein